MKNPPYGISTCISPRVARLLGRLYSTGEVKGERYRHFVCEAYHRIYDLPLAPGMKMEESVQRETGHEVNRHTTEFYGRCWDCAAMARAGEPSATRRPEVD